MLTKFAGIKIIKISQSLLKKLSKAASISWDRTHVINELPKYEADVRTCRS